MRETNQQIIETFVIFRISGQRTWSKISTWRLSHAQKLASFICKRETWIKLKNSSTEQGIKPYKAIVLLVCDIVKTRV